METYRGLYITPITEMQQRRTLLQMHSLVVQVDCLGNPIKTVSLSSNQILAKGQLNSHAY